jgi:hypothetical protein
MIGIKDNYGNSLIEVDIFWIETWFDFATQESRYELEVSVHFYLAKFILECANRLEEMANKDKKEFISCINDIQNIRRYLHETLGGEVTYDILSETSQNQKKGISKYAEHLLMKFADDYDFNFFID